MHHSKDIALESFYRRLLRLNIEPGDIREDFIRGSGSGGQKINKTSSCVRLTHLPSGVTVRCQEARGQFQNRIRAWQMLCEKFEEIRVKEDLEKRQAREKKKRQKRGRPYKVKQKILDSKKKRSLIKKQRKKVDLS